MTDPSSPKRIIHGAAIEGVTFLSPSDHSPESYPHMEEAKKSYRLSKSLSNKIAEKKVHAQELEELWEEGWREGYQRGLLEGQKQGYRNGKEEGFEEGFKKGIDKKNQELGAAIEVAYTIVASLKTRREEMFEQAKPELIKFSLAVCEKMIRRELSHSQSFIALLEALLNQAKNVLKEAAVSIILSPEDYSMLQNEISNISYDKHHFRELDLQEDPTIPRGNCRIQTPLGLINFDIQRLLTNIEEKVLSTSL